MICQADTIGVFQIESRAQMSMLPRLKPRCYYDLVIEVAIVRPGPIQGQMVHPYLRRRAGQERVVYANDAIRRVLKKTLGVPIFQEQAMRLAVVAAGFTPGEADQLRRAMGAWRRPGVIDSFRKKLIDGMRQRGLSRKFAERIFQQIRGFGEYGFPESHAASFALLVYVSAWIKYHYPDAFAAALINSQPMGFYAPAQLVRDARQHGIEVLPADVNHSDWDCTLQPAAVSQSCTVPFALRLGLRMIGGFSETHAECIQQARTKGPFRSLEDFTRRTRLSRTVVTRLARADALASLGRNRRQALWEALSQEESSEELPLFDFLESEDEKPVELPALEPLEEVFRDYETTGLSLKAHPISFYRVRLDQLGVTPAGQLPTIRNNQLVRVAGLVLLRQRPSTAKGITFVTLEDETGTANLVVRQPVWQRYYAVARRSPAWVAHGKLECEQSVIHVVVNRIEDFARATGNPSHQLQTKARDFR
jgi:error-prone DNA polymerase